MDVVYRAIAPYIDTILIISIPVAVSVGVLFYFWWRAR